MLNCFSCVHFVATLWTIARQAPLSWDSPGKNTRVGCHFLLQEIVPTQGSTSGLLHRGSPNTYMWKKRKQVERCAHQKSNKKRFCLLTALFFILFSHFFLLSISVLKQTSLPDSPTSTRWQRANLKLPFRFQVSQRKGAEAEKWPMKRNCKIRINNRFSYFKIPAFYKFENISFSLLRSADRTVFKEVFVAYSSVFIGCPVPSWRARPDS